MLLSVFSFSGNAQNQPKKADIERSSEYSFAIEVNTESTPDDLKDIEKLLKKEYDIQITFENVNIVDKKINGLKMKLINGNQTISRSINNVNTPINPFIINVTDNGDKNYSVSIENKSL